jgi:hypothetical protein
LKETQHDSQVEYSGNLLTTEGDTADDAGDIGVAGEATMFACLCRSLFYVRITVSILAVIRIPGVLGTEAFRRIPADTIQFVITRAIA